MKKYIVIILVICIYSCKRECKAPKDVLTGKVKSWIEYTNLPDTNSVYTRFRFYYDTTNGNLLEVRLDKKINGSFYNDLAILFKRINDDKIQINYEQDTSFVRVFNVYTQSKRITKFTELDTINNIETNLTLYYPYSDSLYDVGFNPSLNTNISLYNFNFIDDNCTSYITSADYVVSFPFPQSYFISDTLNIVYNVLSNDNKARFQIPGCRGVDNSSIIRILSPFLLLDGYFFVRPNKYLIDSIVTNDGTEKYDYYFTGNLITKMTYIYRKNNTTISTYIDYY